MGEEATMVMYGVNRTKKNRKIRQIRMGLIGEESLQIVIEIAITRICHIMLMKRKRKRSMLILAWYVGGQIMIITDLCTVQLPDSVIGGSNPRKKETLFSLSS